MKKLILGAAVAALAAACGGGGKPEPLGAGLDGQLLCNPIAQTTMRRIVSPIHSPTGCGGHPDLRCLQRAEDRAAFCKVLRAREPVDVHDHHDIEQAKRRIS